MCPQTPHEFGESVDQSCACFIKVTGKRDPERLAARQRAQRKVGRDFDFISQKTNLNFHKVRPQQAPASSLLLANISLVLCH